jgi:GTP-binding protein Era
MNEIPKDYRAGYVALVGRPNVGKSTLMNALLGQKIAAVSPRPQTTRQRQLGILTLEDAQIVFMDTPGLHVPAHKLGEYMNQVAEDTLEDADLIVWLVEANNSPTEEDLLIAGKLRAVKHLPPVILAINKTDLLPAEDLPARMEAYRALLPKAELLAFSALTGHKRTELLEAVLRRMPPGAPFFSPDQLTDFYERDIAADLIREASLLHLREEIPHGVAVRIDEFTERGESGAYIFATIFVERESHKGIAIGKGGEMLKRIGMTARHEIESMSGRKVFLELRVKVNKNWRNKPDALRWLGYVREKK